MKALKIALASVLIAIGLLIVVSGVYNPQAEARINNVVGGSMGNINDVFFATNPTNNQLLNYQAASGAWVNTSKITLDSLDVTNFTATYATTTNLVVGDVAGSGLDVLGDLTVGTSTTADGKVLTVDSGDGEILIGGTLQGGNLILVEDGGAMSAFNMQVTADPTAGTQQGYSFEVDDQTIFKVYTEADSAGSIKNEKLVYYAGTQDYASTTDATAATTTLGLDEKFVFVDDIGTGIDIILPDSGASATGTIFHIIDQSGDAGTHEIRITCETITKTISGAVTSTISTNYNTVSVISDGTNWLAY